MSAIPSIKPLSDKWPAWPAKDRLADGRTTAAPGRRKAAGGRAPGADRRGKLKRAGIEMKISPHKLRHTYAPHRLDAGAERADIEAPLGHERIATTRIDTDVGQERMERVVARL